MDSGDLAAATLGAVASNQDAKPDISCIHGEENDFEPMKKIEAEIKAVAQMDSIERDEFAEWVWIERDLNMFDPDVIRYPRATMLKASNGEGALVYIPLQPVLMYDAIAAKPGLDAKKQALAMWRIVELVDQIQRDLGYGESYFLCRDDRVADICLKHGFEEVENVRILRRKVEMPKPDA